MYCSNPTSPGGGYRSALGRIFFKTKEMIQVVEAPDIIRNKVAFSVLGFLDGDVSLKGKFSSLDSVPLRMCSGLFFSPMCFTTINHELKLVLHKY